MSRRFQESYSRRAVSRVHRLSAVARQSCLKSSTAVTTVGLGAPARASAMRHRCGGVRIQAQFWTVTGLSGFRQWDPVAFPFGPRSRYARKYRLREGLRESIDFPRNLHIDHCRHDRAGANDTGHHHRSRRWTVPAPPLPARRSPPPIPARASYTAQTPTKPGITCCNNWPSAPMSWPSRQKASESSSGRISSSALRRHYPSMPRSSSANSSRLSRSRRRLPRCRRQHPISGRLCRTRSWWICRFSLAAMYATWNSSPFSHLA